MACRQLISVEYNVTPSGGAEAGGNATLITPNYFVEGVSGGAEGGGQAAVSSDQIEEVAGGAEAGGTAAVSLITCGGGESAGSASVENLYSPSGGAEAGGEAEESYSYSPIGGGAGGGQATVTSDHIEEPSGGGESGGNVSPIISIAVSGGAESSSGTVEPDFSTYSPSGGAESGGSSLAISTVEITTEFDITWNTGECVPYFWQVEGICTQYVCNNSSFKDDGECSRRFVATVLGCNLKEVCEKLNAQGYRFQLGKVLKFSRPALTRHQNLFDGCNEVEVVFDNEVDSYDDLPDICEQYTLSGDVLSEWGWQTFVEITGDVVGQGFIEFSGDAEMQSSAYSMIGDGGLYLDGDAVQQSDSNFGTLEVSAGAFAEVIDLEAIFGEEFSEFAPEYPDIINACDCDPLPSVLEMSHNLSDSLILSQFIQRNKLVLPRVVDLHYSNLNSSWYESLHFEGLNPDGSNVEKWNILFEWSCEEEVGGVALGNEVWKWSMLARRTVIGQDDFETRVLLAFNKYGVCPPDATLRFNFTLNTVTEIVTSTSFNDVDVDVKICNDGIGMFKSAFWLNNPSLRVTITELGGIEPFPATFDTRRFMPAPIGTSSPAPIGVSSTPSPIFS